MGNNGGRDGNSIPFLGAFDVNFRLELGNKPTNREGRAGNAQDPCDQQ